MSRKNFTEARPSGKMFRTSSEFSASIECCEGGNFLGRAALAQYWRPRLARAVANAFEIDVLMPFDGGVSLDYRGYDGVPVRTLFRFSDTGKISQTVCAPIKQAA